MESPADNRRVLRAYLWPDRRTIALLAGVLALGTALPVAAPQLIARFVDAATTGEPTSRLIGIAALYLVVAVAAQVTTIFTTWVASHQAWSATNRLRESLAGHALRLDLSFHAKHSPGELIERVDGDVHAIAQFLVTFLVDICGSGLLIAATIVVLAFEDLRLGGAMALFVGLIGFLLVRVQRHAVPTVAAFRASQARLFGDIEEHLAAAEDLRANGAGAHVMRRFHEVSADTYRADQRAEIVGGGLVRLANFGFTIGTALLLGVGFWLHDAGAISLGATVALFNYTQLIRQPLERIIDQMEYLQGALAGSTRASELLAMKSSLAVGAEAAQPLGSGPVSVELDHVGFAFPDDGVPVLHDVSLVLPAGRSIGLVGRTGGGKTTIARLVLRLYDPTEGVIRLDGHDLRAVDPADFRRRVAVVTQDVQLYPSTVRDNITLFGTLAADDGGIIRILAELGLGEWFAALPDGLDTGLAEAGLSAGEAQLLTLARAFLADPGLVVLDEASSRLDPGTEADIERALDRLLAGRTAIVIAHRLSSLDRVDDIAVIEGGRVIEHGSRADLAADASSRFARLLAASTLGARP